MCRMDRSYMPCEVSAKAIREGHQEQLRTSGTDSTFLATKLLSLRP